VAPETDFSKGLELEMPTSPPMNLHHLTSVTDSLGFGHSPPPGQSHPSKSNNPTRAAPEMVPAKTQTGPDAPGKKSADKAVSVEAAERDWEEKRAALAQYSAKDINRLLEETQAELMKAIPDLDFAAKHKPAAGGSAASTPEHKPSKPQPKAGGKGDPNGRRGSDELTVPRYRTEKPSKSPPPPPPRRSFPSSHGLTTTRSGEVIVTSKKEPGFMKKAESEELETQKPQVKLRRTVSEVVRPASTPPIIASAIKDDDDEDRIIAELEVFQRSSGSPFPPKLRSERRAAPVSPGLADLWPNGAPAVAQGWKEAAALAAPGSRAFSLPQIVLTEWVSEPPSPEAEAEVRVGCWEHWDAAGSTGAQGGPAPEPGRRCHPSPGSPKKPLGQPPASSLQSPSLSPAAAETWRLPVAASKGPVAASKGPTVAVKGPAPSKLRQGEAEDALKAGGPKVVTPEGCWGPLAAQPGCPRGEAPGPGADEVALPRSSTVPPSPWDGDPSGGASLPHGDAAGAPREDGSPAPVLPVPSPRAFPAPRGSGWPRAGQPQEQVAAASRPRAAPAGPGGAGGRPAEGLCGGQAALPRSVPPRSREIYDGTCQRLDSLEETIRELELAIGAIGDRPAAELAPREPAGLRDLGRGSRDAGTALDLSRATEEAPRGGPSPSKARPPLLPKPQLPLATAQSGGVSIPAMKVVTPASRLKQGQQGQQGSPDKPKHLKQRVEYGRVPGQQQVGPC
ncbi:SRCN1 inhibitor, partial [Rhinopomastus cyanomelas]|nr:SRCN1 inhibitor [Rhinopomastus cyanomelas]